MFLDKVLQFGHRTDPRNVRQRYVESHCVRVHRHSFSLARCQRYTRRKSSHLRFCQDCVCILERYACYLLRALRLRGRESICTGLRCLRFILFGFLRVGFPRYRLRC